MPVIKWSTLKKIHDTRRINLEDILPNLQLSSLQYSINDYFINITIAEKIRLNNAIEQSLGVNNHVDLNSQIQEITDRAENTFNLLKKNPFRQSRNAFGFASAMIGLVNSGIGLLSLSIYMSSSLVFIPAIIIGICIYFRGKKEESQINRDYETKIFDEKIKLIILTNEIIRLRNILPQYRITNLPSAANLAQTQPPYEPVNPYSEKRWINANALSHYLVPLASTSGMILSFLKFGFFASLICASGPAAWGAAIGTGICVGAYFSYKRYHNLMHKKTLEINLHQIEQHKKTLESQKEFFHKKILLLSAAQIQQNQPDMNTNRQQPRCTFFSKVLYSPVRFFKTCLRTSNSPVATHQPTILFNRGF